MIVLGCNGLVGRYVIKALQEKNMQYLGVDIGENIYNQNNYMKLNVLKQGSDLYELFDTYNELNDNTEGSRSSHIAVVNCIGYTDVDGAEDPKKFQDVMEQNVFIPLNIAAALENAYFEGTLFHLSSDYVWGEDGIGFYGKTKELSENILSFNYSPSFNLVIGRTSVVYGEQKGFVKWLYKKLKNKEPVKIVVDQISSPTYAGELANQILYIHENKAIPKYQITLAGKESMSRYEFACRIAKFFNLDVSLISPCYTKDLNQKSPRPYKDFLVEGKNFLLSRGYRPRNLEECLSCLNEKELQK